MIDGEDIEFADCTGLDGTDLPALDADFSDFGEVRDGFPMRRNQYHLARLHAAKAQDKILMRRMRRMIQPSNAAELAHHLPIPGETLHAVVRGDFVMCDLLTPLLSAAGAVQSLTVATLGMSVANAAFLRNLLDTGAVQSLTVLVSHYFSQVDKVGTFLQCRQILGDDCLIVARSHAKLFLLEGDCASLVVEGSANLRSSGCIEQFTIANDPALLLFHRAWIEGLRK